MYSAAPLNDTSRSPPLHIEHQNIVRLRTIWLAVTGLVVFLFSVPLLNGFYNSTLEVTPTEPVMLSSLIDRITKNRNLSHTIIPEVAVVSKRLCSKTIKPLTPIMLVHTQSTSKKLREFLRALRPSTLGAYSLIFTAGLPDDSEAYTQLVDEVSNHKDLIIGEYFDSEISDYQLGVITGLRHLSTCSLETDAYSSVLVSIPETSTTNYRDLTNLVIALEAIGDWDDFVDAQKFKAVELSVVEPEPKRHSNTAIISTWNEIESAKRALRLKGSQHPTKMTKILAPTDTFITRLDAAKAMIKGVDHAGSQCAETEETECYDTAISAVIGDNLDKQGILKLTTPQFVTRAQDICSSAECSCGGWLIRTNAQATSAMAAQTQLFERCEQAFEPPKNNDIAPLTGLSGTSNRGPPIPLYKIDPDFCTSVDSGVVIGILTKISDFKVREHIREWYGAREPTSKLLFAVGRRPGKSGEANDKLIDEEQRKHKDLIIGDFYDHYHTLSSKTMMLMKWVTTCDKVKWLVKSDVDMRLHPRATFEWLEEIDKNGLEGREIWEKQDTFATQRFTPEAYPFWIGRTFKHNTMGLLKSVEHRNYEDINITRFPTYCSGPLYIVSRKMAELLVKTRTHFAVRDVYFRNEDAMIGLLVQRWNKDNFPHHTQLNQTTWKDISDLPTFPFRAGGIFTMGVHSESGICSAFSFPLGNNFNRCTCTRVLAASQSKEDMFAEMIDKCKTEPYDSRDYTKVTLQVPPQSSMSKHIGAIVNTATPAVKSVDRDLLKSLLYRGESDEDTLIFNGQ